MKIKEVSPKNDIVFKKLFGVKGREQITKDLLEGLLERKIDSVTLGIETELLPDFYDRKSSTVDVLAELGDGSKVNIEMQIDPSKYSEKRCLQYWSKLYSNALENGERYEDLKKTICIWIVDGLVYDEFEKFDSTWKMQENSLGITGHFEEIEIHIIELQKFRNLDIIKPSKKEFWLWFIDHINKEMIEMACIDNEKIKEAREQYERITSDKELMHIIIRQQMAEWDEASLRAKIKEEATAEGIAEGKAKGKAEGIAEGKAEGIIEAKLEIAKKMKMKGLDIEMIIETTGLSKEEIERI